VPEGALPIPDIEEDGRMTRKGGESADDAHLGWVRPVRHGRQGGVKVYVDAYTLREALRAAGFPERTPFKDLEVLRKTMAHGTRGRAQVLLIFRLRREGGGFE